MVNLVKYADKHCNVNINDSQHPITLFLFCLENKQLILLCSAATDSVTQLKNKKNTPETGKPADMITKLSNIAAISYCEIVVHLRLFLLSSIWRLNLCIVN